MNRKKETKKFRIRNAAGIAAAVAVACIFAGTFYIKFRIFNKGVNLKAGEFGLFRVEEATRYRYAKLAGEGKKIPGLDKRIQYPEGLNVKKHFTTLSQRTMGFVYRALGLKTPFYRFVIIFMFLYSSLSVLALYKTAFLMTGQRLLSLAACLFYATSFASSSRTIAGGLVEEDFALPLMFFALMFVIKTLKSSKYIYGAAAGILLALASASWHVTQFFYLILLGIIGAIFILSPEKRRPVTALILPVILLQTAAGIIVPVLRGEYFLISFGQLAGYSLATASILAIKFPVMRRQLLLAASIAALFGALFFVSDSVAKKREKNYGHVYSLMLNKIKYFGNKPTFEKEVKKLPFDTKVLWQSSFVSPKTNFIRDIFLIVFLFALPGMAAAARRILKYGDAPAALNFALFVTFFALFLLIKRLYVYVIFFICLFIPYAADFLKTVPLRAGAAALLLSGVFVQTRQALPKLRAVPHRINNYKQDVLKWMNANLPAKSVILCNIGFAPEIVQNSTFSTVLHNHYEAKDIRDKTKEFYDRMYGDENGLWNFAEKYGAQYLLYHWEFLIDKSVSSVRYQVDAMTVFRSEVCYKLHFAPRELKHFELIFQNEYYRVYRILGKNERPGMHEMRYVPFFDSRVFEPQDKISVIAGKRDKGPVFDDDYAKDRMNAVWSLPKLKSRADSLAAGGHIYEAERLYEKMLSIDPYYRRTRMIISDFYMRAGEYAKAVPHLEWMVRNYPGADSFYFLITALRAAGEKRRASGYEAYAHNHFPKDKRFYSSPRGIAY